MFGFFVENSLTGYEYLYRRTLSVKPHRCFSQKRFEAYRSRIHEHTISLRFLGIILRVLRLEVSVQSPLQLNCRNCKRLREFEEI